MPDIKETNKPRLFQRILLFQIVFISIITAAYGVLTYRDSYDREINAQNDTMTRIEKRLTSGLSIPFWNLEKNTVERLIREEIENPYLAGIVLFHRDGIWFGGAKTVPGAGIQSIQTQADIKAFLGNSQARPRRAIAYVDRNGTTWQAGELALYTTDRPIIESLTALLARTVSQALLLIASLSVMTILLLNGLLHRPLKQMAATALRIGNGETGLRAAVPGTRELATLAGAFNTMTARRRETEGEIRRLNESLEARVAERTARLEELNREMETFAYSITHDLRAPLRAINGYLDLLNETSAAAFDDEGRRIMGVVRDETTRMDRMIGNLLEFSRIGRAALTRQYLAMAGLARSVFAEIAAPETQARIAFSIGRLPDAYGDPTLIRLVWMNLLSNAVKFSSRTARPAIAVEGAADGEEAVYRVRDNGVGFDMRSADKLFGVFQRLHAAQDFEGNGIGLAIVQRVVAMHGGRVWAESEPGRETTFSFSLPRPDERPAS